MPIHLSIRDQPRLGLRRTLAITWTGIRYRLFRSFMTLLVIAVAIAFLTNMVVGSLLRSSVIDHARAETQRLRLASYWVSRLTFPASPLELVGELAAAQPGDRTVREFALMEGEAASDAESAELHQDAQQAQRYLDWFARLKYVERRTLLGRVQGLDVFTRLGTAETREAFWQQLREFRSVRAPDEREAFDAFLERWPAVLSRFEFIAAVRAEAVGRVNAYLGERPPLEAMAPLDGELVHVMREARFLIPQEELGIVAGQARDILLSNSIEKAAQDPRFRQGWVAQLDARDNAVSLPLIWQALREPENAAWFAGQLGSAAVPDAEALDAATLQRLADARAYLNSLTAALRDTSDTGGGLLGLGERLTYLLGISLLVCAVGITNAMLMSVTERYREIATLKCLGALDSSILNIFVMEACLLGVAGASAGAVLGTLIGALRAFAAYQGLVLTMLPTASLVLCFVGVILVGVLLAGVASVYPSLKAAQLAPMEAMRIE